MKRRLMAGLLVPLIWAVQAQAQPLTQQQALQRLGEQVLLPSGGTDEVTASMSTTSLASGIVQPMMGSTPTVNIADFAFPQWFAIVDAYPCRMFEHEVTYVFIDDDVAGGVTVFTAYDWPEIDGIEFGGAYDLVMVFPLLPRPNPIDPVATSGQPVGDYGDAPDGVWAYREVVGAFPTYYATSNSLFGRPGIHMLGTGMEMLGTMVSDEQDVVDPADPDGVTNMRDADSDERMFLAWDPSTYPPTAHLIYDVTIAAGAPAGDRYVNALFDFDRSGNWALTPSGTVEWAINNQIVNLAPGTTATIISPPFPWEDGGEVPTQVWMRVALTRDSIDADGSLFGAVGWDGSGAFDYGEVEDFETYVRRCIPAKPPVNIPPPPPPIEPPVPGVPNPPPPPDGGGGGGPAPPGPTDMMGKPISYYALVVQGPDKGSDTACEEAGDTMEGLLGAQGYGSSDPNAPDDAGPDRLGPGEATEANIQAWIDDLVPNVLCKDHVVIYIVGHGSETAGGSISLGENVTGSELADMLDKIPSDQCDGMSCKNSGCCDVTVIVESCYAGNFKDALAGPGRNIYVSSSSSQPSQYGHDGSGGEYSDRYADAKRNRANADADGYVTPGAAHDGAGSWGGQTPGEDEQGCTCIPTEHETVKLTIFLDGPSVVPVPSGSTGIGYGHVVLDLTTDTLEYYILTSGTTGTPMPGLSGIYGFAPPGTVAPLLVPFDEDGPPYSGTYEYEEWMEPELMSGMAYVQINTDEYPEGEIRGQLEWEEVWQIQPGDDLFDIPEGGGGAGVVFGDGDNPPIPPDFFGPGSDPFEGHIGFDGAPPETEPPFELGPSSVVVRRLGGAALPGPGAAEDVPVQIVGLSLVSSEPVPVTFGGGMYTEYFDVTMTLSSTVPDQPIGMMTIIADDHYSGKGGIFLLDLPVQPSYTFTSTGGGGGSYTYDPASIGLPAMMFHMEDGHWMKHDPGLGLYTHEQPALLDHDGDPVTPPMIIEPTVPFFPGVGLYRCDPGDPMSWTQYFKRVVHGDAGYATLNLMPAQCLDVGGVLDCAAPLPDTDGDFIPDGTDSCILDPNPMQFDGDADGVGDACDNCPMTPNTCQKDTDMDGVGNACDTEDIPTTGTVALIVLAVLLLAGGSYALRRRVVA